MGDKNENEFICRCFAITRMDIENIIKSGCTTLIEVQNKTHCGTGCGLCIDKVQIIIDETIKH